MKKFIGALLVTLFLATGSLLLMPNESQAVPAFARQTGLACDSCHFQSYPLLNAFGRAFKSGGYTLVGGESLISGDALSLPSVLNAAVFFKARYTKTNGSRNTDPTKGPVNTEDKNNGRLDMPDESSLFAAGRVGENIGFLAEIALPGAASLANFKMPFVFHAGEANISIIPFTSDALGPQAAFELLNTGAVGSGRLIEHGKQISAAQFIGTTDNGSISSAEGLALVASLPMGFIDYTAYVPQHTASEGLKKIASYIRAAVTPNLGGWDLGLGVQWWGGTAAYSNGGVITEVRPRAYAIDAQAQGEVGNMPLGVYLSYANARKTDSATANTYNAGPNNRSAFAVSAMLGVIPSKVQLTAGYLAGKVGDAADTNDNAVTLAAAYKVTQNSKLELSYSHFSGSAQNAGTSINGAGGNQKTTLVMSAAF